MTKQRVSRTKQEGRTGPVSNGRPARGSGRRWLLPWVAVAGTALVAAVVVAVWFPGKRTVSPQPRAADPAMASVSHPESSPQTGQRPSPPETFELNVLNVKSLREECARIADRLCEDYPGDVSAMLEAGIIYARNDASAEALRCWEHCSRLRPKQADIWSQMALLALTMGESEKAAEFCRQALQIDRFKPGVHYRLACALMEQGMIEEAIDALEKESKISPDMSKTHYLLGVAHQQLNEYAQAKKNFEAVIRTQPNHLNAYYGLVRVCAKLGEKSESEKYRQKFQQLQAQSRKALVDEKRTYDDVAESCALTAETYTDAGRIYHRRGNAPTAEKYWLRAAELNPKNTVCRQQLTSLYATSNRNREAVRMCEQLVAIDPQDASYHFTLSVLCARLNRLDTALAAVQRALELDPDNQRYTRIQQEIRERK